MPPRKTQKHDFPALLSFWFPGLGQLIKGHVLKGILTMFVSVTLLLLLWIISLVFTIALTLTSVSEVLTVTHGYLVLVTAICWLIISFSFWMWNVYDAYNAN